MKKICVVITARSSYARLKTVLRELNKDPDMELILIAAASLLLPKYGNAIEIVERDGFRVSEKAHILVEGGDTLAMAKTAGLGIADLVTIFDKYKPDIVISVADRFETISTAIAASYMNIPIAHIQGGELSGSIDEKVRHAVTKLSNLHFVANVSAARRVRQMGESDDRIFITGCPSIDLAKEVRENLNFFDNDYFYAKYSGPGDKLDIDKSFVIVLQHPVTTELNEAFQQMQETLNAVHEKKIPAIIFWPNADAGTDMTSKAIRMFREHNNPKNFFFLKNTAPEDFLALLIKSKCIVGNSSVAIREGSYLGVPAVNIGTRQNGRERGKNIIDVSYSKKEIVDALQRQLCRNKPFASEALYGDGTAGVKIAHILSETTPPSEKRFVE